VGKAALTQCRAKHYVVEEGAIVDRQREVTTGLSLLAHLLNGENPKPLSHFGTDVDTAIGVPVRTGAQTMDAIEREMRGDHAAQLAKTNRTTKQQLFLIDVWDFSLTGLEIIVSGILSWWKGCVSWFPSLLRTQ